MSITVHCRFITAVKTCPCLYIIAKVLLCFHKLSESKLCLERECMNWAFLIVLAACRRPWRLTGENVEFVPCRMHLRSGRGGLKQLLKQLGDKVIHHLRSPWRLLWLLTRVSVPNLTLSYKSRFFHSFVKVFIWLVNNKVIGSFFVLMRWSLSCN